MLNQLEYQIDDLILATGFNAMTGAIKNIEITNEDGMLLSDTWSNGPKTYLGLMVAGYSNLFLITGPQSPGVKSQMILSIEQHVNMIANIMNEMHKKNAIMVDALDSAKFRALSDDFRVDLPEN